jgi:hypothetical protein
VSSEFRLRDAFRDLVRAPRAAWVAILAGLGGCVVPMVLSAVRASRLIAQAPDGHAAFNAYVIWCAIAIPLAVIGARVGAAVIASNLVEGPRPRRVPLLVVTARVLAHGVPAALAALLGVIVAGLGLLVVAAAAVPVVAGEEIVRVHAGGAPTMIAGVLATALALVVFVAAVSTAAWLAALTLPVGPASAAEKLPPSAALRRGGTLARRAPSRLALWTVGLLVVEIAPLAVARLTAYDGGKKPPVAPVLQAMHIHAAIVIAVAAIAALAQVAVYSRLRNAK